MESEKSKQGELTPRDPLAELAVVIPIGPGDESWRALLQDLCRLPPDAELLLVGTEPEPIDLRQLLEELGVKCHSRWQESPPGRARQQNRGAELATNNYLWFLHADSRVSIEAIEQLGEALARGTDSLWFFDLQFRDDGPRAAQWNARGANFRARKLGLPFGDQGFCLRRETFRQLGGFDEQASYGEDHLLVWKAKQQGVALQSINAAISTSARKYAEHGWLRTTVVHLGLTVKQALPEWWKLMRSQR